MGALWALRHGTRRCAFGSRATSGPRSAPPLCSARGGADMRRYTSTTPAWRGVSRARTGASAYRGARFAKHVALASGLLLICTTTTTPAWGDATLDIDGDGFAATAGDCQPLDPSIGPQAADLPDLDFIDADCDGIDGDGSVAVFVAPDGSDSN